MSKVDPSARDEAPISRERIEANRRFFEEKLSAERQLSDVVGAVRAGSSPDFVLLDIRGRDAYAKAHIPGALCVPLEEIPTLAALLPRQKELATYCWAHT